MLTSKFFMRTERAPTTALSGKNISDDALVISTAILATPYAAFQAFSLDDPGSSSIVSVGPQSGEAIAKAMALDEAASALRSFTRGWNVASSCFMYSTMGDVGVGGGLFVGVAGDEDFFRKRFMTEGKATLCLAPWRLARRTASRSQKKRLSADGVAPHGCLILITYYAPKHSTRIPKAKEKNVCTSSTETERAWNRTHQMGPPRVPVTEFKNNLLCQYLYEGQ